MVKEKINSIRTYDADGLRKRAACLCIRDNNPAEVITYFLNKIIYRRIFFILSYVKECLKYCHFYNILHTYLKIVFDIVTAYF